MKSLKYISIVIMVMMLGACVAPVKEGKESKGGEVNYEIVELMPHNIEGFSYRGLQSYPEPWGYSLRYRFDESRMIHSDVYIYPVPDAAVNLRHEDVVVGMTKQALGEIDYATKKGAYSDYHVIAQSDFNLMGRYVKRVDVYLVKNNLASYSLIFLTESHGKLLKVRMTMPDNKFNRNSNIWQEFVVKTFSVILNNIDKA